MSFLPPMALPTRRDVLAGTVAATLTGCARPSDTASSLHGPQSVSLTVGERFGGTVGVSFPSAVALGNNAAVVLNRTPALGAGREHSVASLKLAETATTTQLLDVDEANTTAVADANIKHTRMLPNGGEVIVADLGFYYKPSSGAEHRFIPLPQGVSQATDVAYVAGKGLFVIAANATQQTSMQNVSYINGSLIHYTETELSRLYDFEETQDTGNPLSAADVAAAATDLGTINPTGMTVINNRLVILSAGDTSAQQARLSLVSFDDSLTIETVDLNAKLSTMFQAQLSPFAVGQDEQGSFIVFGTTQVKDEFQPSGENTQNALLFKIRIDDNLTWDVSDLQQAGRVVDVVLSPDDSITAVSLQVASSADASLVDEALGNLTYGVVAALATGAFNLTSAPQDITDRQTQEQAGQLLWTSSNTLAAVVNAPLDSKDGAQLVKITVNVN